MDMPCRQVFSAGQRQVEVRGPFKELEAEKPKDLKPYGLDKPAVKRAIEAEFVRRGSYQGRLYA